jgi:RimJ/RimL family protein N-acetyltransferase
VPHNPVFINEVICAWGRQKKRNGRDEKRTDRRHGRQRIVNTTLQEANDENDYRIRRARDDDTFLLWLWANDPQTRKNSFKSEPIAWSTHKAWCSRSLSSPNSRIWILEHSYLPIGQIRYERVSAETAQISFCVAPRFRGKGVGTRLLQSTIHLAGRELGVHCVQGVTFLDNRASRGAFLKARFQVIEEKAIGGRACLIFQRSCVLELAQEAGSPFD